MKKILSRYTPNEWLILALFISSFISVFAVTGLLILTPVYFFVTKQAKKALPRNVFESLIFVFAALGVLFTFIYGRDSIWNYVKNTYALKEWYVKGLSILIVILAFDMTFLFRIVTRRALMDGLKFSVLLSYPCFLVAVVQRIFGLMGRSNDPGRVPSVFLNENYYGVALECLTLIALYFMLKEKEWKIRLFYLGSILVNIAGLWLSKCRTAFLVIAISFVIFLCVYNKKYIFGITIATALVFAALCLFPTIIPRGESLSDSLDLRIGIWNTALEEIKNSPLIGRGYFCYSWLYLEHEGAQFALHAHNMYLEILLNFGLFGFLSLFVYSGYQAVKTIRACMTDSIKNRCELCLTVSILAALIVHGMVDTTVFWPQTGVFFGLILGASRIYLPQTDANS